MKITAHQQNQIKVIDEIGQQIKKNSLRFSTVSPIDDYENDPRISLTNVHFPNEKLTKIIQNAFINPLIKIHPNHYFYSNDSLHMTIKNIRVVSNPPQFTQCDVKHAKNIFQDVIPKHNKFYVYFYRLMLFPHNLSLIGTTDPELNKIVLDLDNRLKKANIPDDKQYVNSQFSFPTLPSFVLLHQLLMNLLKKLKNCLNT
ncbi:hypothetical protein COY87_04940 [Candidatus Roizmanbacteria bacterium CG_4_10_14_0_8_um_filter_33_9]|uniref:Uncharacterized protein n=1 Tax=Candidatus Roizmanbacteria bacterium CG_4_10_14_0_8_um_filter_33_9 TaxID=1974826 RepID=A0A2M7QH71_9BACT|nr:MAG: hypothetical protein COY87_04940 [Candidatus Roizmanbacteria bacterium CG_4_10_14_0_8_um_filter_33_9]